MNQFNNRCDYFSIGPENRVTFTVTGKQELAPLFAMAGININTIKTKSQLKQAYEACGPYLNQRHMDIARNGKPSLERNALIAIATGDYVEADRIKDLLRRRKRLRLV